MTKSHKPTACHQQNQQPHSGEVGDGFEPEVNATRGILAAFQQHQAALQRYIYRLMGRRNDIDDIAQEAFLRAYQAEKNSAEGIQQPKSFLFKIAHNLAITSLTRKSSKVMDYLSDIDEMPEQPLTHALVDEVIASQTVGLHCEAVAQLPLQCRRVYLMRKVHGMSHREIAQTLGISHRTVEKHIAKGARDCARYLTAREQKDSEQEPLSPLAEVKSFSGESRHG